MCKNCAICVCLVLAQYNLLTDAYHVIGLAYKFLLTLSTTLEQRAFPPLSLLKTDYPFMLMSTEKDILMSLDSDGVINKVAKTRDLL